MMQHLDLSKVDAEIYKKALGNLLRKKGYHLAPPSKKNEMMMKECAKLLRKKHSHHK